MGHSDISTTKKYYRNNKTKEHKAEEIYEKNAVLRRFLTGDERIELPLRVLETPVMPFDQSPSIAFCAP